MFSRNIWHVQRKAPGATLRTKVMIYKYCNNLIVSSYKFLLIKEGSALKKINAMFVIFNGMAIGTNG